MLPTSLSYVLLMTAVVVGRSRVGGVGTEPTIMNAPAIRGNERGWIGDEWWVLLRYTYPTRLVEGMQSDLAAQVFGV